MKRVIVVAGPTASGKTSLAISLAKELDGEVVSADSMQIYQYMNIGTAKPTIEEMEGIPHHLLDFVSPLDAFDVVQYQKMALDCIADILDRGKQPIVCGGTGLYINSLIYNLSYGETEADPSFREKMAEEAKRYGNQYLHDRLQAVDPKAAATIHPNNVKRVIRALEVYETTGTLFSEQLEASRQNPAPYDYACVGLDLPRDYLYARIDKRVDMMLEAGLLQETQALLEKGLLEGPTASMGICYKELLPYLREDASLEFCAEKLKQGTRNYAKRQMTWFRRIPTMHWISVGPETSKEEIVEQALSIINL